MKFLNVKRLATTCFFVIIFMLASYGNSYASCAFLSLTPQGTFPPFGSGGGSSHFFVNGGVDRTLPSVPRYCRWQVSSNPFIHTSPWSGIGPDQIDVTFSVDPNPNLAARTGFITVKDGEETPQTQTINQAASPGDFSLLVSSGFPTITKGAAVSFNVFIGRSGGFTGSVCLSVSQLPAGANAQFSAQCTTGNSVVMTIFTSGATPVGNFTAVVAGQNATVSRFAPAPFTVNDFSISVNPSTLSVVQGGSGTSAQVTINPINGFSGPVSLGPSNVPAGVGFGFSPNPTMGPSVITVNANEALVSVRFFC